MSANGITVPYAEEPDETNMRNSASMQLPRFRASKVAPPIIILPAVVGQEWRTACVIAILLLCVVICLMAIAVVLVGS